MNINLIITTAVIPEENHQEKLGYSYSERKKQYIDTFNSVKQFKDNFKTITILETVSKEPIDFLDESGFNVYYSKKDNFFLNKGLNEMIHINDFIKNIDENEFFLKISGRYLINNLNLIKYIKNDKIKIIAKNSADIYVGNYNGVHTFYFLSNIKKFYEFYNYINLDFTKNDDKQWICIEWILKDFIDKDKECLILPDTVEVGCKAMLYSKEIDRWTIKNV